MSTHYSDDSDGEDSSDEEVNLEELMRRSGFRTEPAERPSSAADRVTATATLGAAQPLRRIETMAPIAVNNLYGWLRALERAGQIGLTATEGEQKDRIEVLKALEQAYLSVLAIIKRRAESEPEYYTPSVRNEIGVVSAESLKVLGGLTKTRLDAEQPAGQAAVPRRCIHVSRTGSGGSLEACRSMAKLGWALCDRHIFEP